MEKKRSRKANPEEEEAMEKENKSSHVRIKIQTDGLEDVEMRIRRDLELGRVMQMYSRHMGLDQDSLRFTYEGKRIKESHTPDDLRFDDGDVIDVFSYQDGGNGTPTYEFISSVDT